MKGHSKMPSKKKMNALKVVSGTALFYMALSSIGWINNPRSGMKMYTKRKMALIQAQLPPFVNFPQENPLVPILEDIDFSPSSSSSGTPMLWSLPPNDAGGTQIKFILDTCLGLTKNEVFGGDGGAIEWPEGSSDADDVLTLTNLNLMPTLFGPEMMHKQAKMFTMFLHPNHRSMYLFYYLQRNVDADGYDSRIKDMTLLQYLNFLKMEDNQNHKYNYRTRNWMTRELAQKAINVDLVEDDLITATNILRHKSVVGLFNDDLVESFRRFSSIFGWNQKGLNECINTKVGGISTLVTGSVEWNILSEMNQFDIALYNNAKLIFEEQGLKLAGNAKKDISKMFANVVDVKKKGFDSKGIPVFFKPPPSSAGGYVAERLFDSCFDLTREEITSEAGEHTVKYISTKQRFEEVTAEKIETLEHRIIVDSNIQTLRERLQDFPDEKVQMFTFLAHPVLRAKHMIDYLQSTPTDVHYEPKVAGMNLSEYLAFLREVGNENHYHRFRISNWLTRSLSGSSRQDVLGDAEVKEAIDVLKQKFVVGFYDTFEESLNKLKDVFGWEADVNDCLQDPNLPGSYVDGSGITAEEWSSLADLNRKDIQVYEAVKGV